MTQIEELREKLRAPITVTMPAHNAAQTIEEAVRSIQQQTFQDWQLLIVNDHSTDHTLKTALALAQADRRILVTNSQRRGVSGTRNLAFETSSSPYVALQDADDISEPTRFEKQLRFLESHPEVKALGSWGTRINGAGKIISNFDLGPTTLEQAQACRAKGELVALINTSVMCSRQEVLECGGNRHEDYPAEDVALWNRMISRGYAVLVLPERLIRYRIHQNSVTSLNGRFQQVQYERILWNWRTGQNLSVEEYKQLLNRSLLRRIGFERRYVERHYFRNGALHFYNRHPLRAAFFLGISALANPVYTASRLLKGQ
jgi:glycosyltransferase involved in cell wall biosynthesis